MINTAKITEDSLRFSFQLYMLQYIYNENHAER